MMGLELTEKGRRQLAEAMAEELKKETVSNVDRLGLIEEGEMKKGYRVIPGDQAAQAHLINKTPQSEFHERGTGIYGPYKTPIVPTKKGGMLWWKIRKKDAGKYKGPDGKPLGVGAYVSAKSVKGIKGYPTSAPVRRAIVKMAGKD